MIVLDTEIRKIVIIAVVMIYAVARKQNLVHATAIPVIVVGGAALEGAAVTAGIRTVITWMRVMTKVEAQHVHILTLVAHTEIMMIATGAALEGAANLVHVHLIQHQILTLTAMDSQIHVIPAI